MSRYPLYSDKYDRRSGNDRRDRKRFNIRELFIYGRRENIRRQEDLREIFHVDRYSTALFGAIVAILFLSVMDAFLTLFLIDHGAVEINPLMAYYLNIGPLTFIVVKYLLTSLSVFILLMFRNVFFAGIGRNIIFLFTFIIGIFISVVTWQLFLTYRIVF
jgi:hypothetical protein